MGISFLQLQPAVTDVEITPTLQFILVSVTKDVYCVRIAVKISWIYVDVSC